MLIPVGHGHGASRTWTLTDGSTIQGSFLHAKEIQVHVEQADGTIIKIELDRFSEADRQFVAPTPSFNRAREQVFSKLAIRRAKGTVPSCPNCCRCKNSSAPNARTLQAF